MTFWASQKEAFLEFLFGHWQLEAWRAEKKHREECERILQMFKDEAALRSRPIFLKDNSI